MQYDPAMNSTSTHSTSPQPQAASPGWFLILLLLLVQLWSRYVPNPWAAFVADDWANWARSSFYTSHLEAILTGLQDPNRPLSMAAVESLFRIFHNRSICWTLVSVVGNSFMLFALSRMAWGLTGRKAVVLIAGISFALFPNLTETYHWSTQVLNEVTCALMFYAFSGWMWVDYARRGGAWRLALSSVGYFIALFSYEAGLLIPAAYLALLPWKKEPLKSVFRLVPFGVIALLYAAWRVSNSFGLNHSWHYPPHMEAGISLGGIGWNIRQLLGWWAGGNQLESMLSGITSFSTLPDWTRRGLMMGNVVVVTALGGWIKRECKRDATTSPAFTTGQVVLFGLIWTGAAMAIPALSYTASRLNVLPALGVSLLLALLFIRLPLRYWALPLFVPAILALMSNQGTTESYRQVGLANNKLYEHILYTVDEWRDMDAIYLDTSAVRQRLTPDLISATSDDQYTWAVYRNAPLWRGFLTRGMVQMALGELNPKIDVLHDVENGIHTSGEMFYWHDRYDSSRPHSNLLARVYRVDAGLVSSRIK